MIDKGEGKGALVYSEREVTERKTGAPVATLYQTTFCRGDGGFGGPPREAPAPHVLPERTPDHDLRSADAPGNGADLPAFR